MAETNSSLGFSSKLQIIVVPSGKTYATPTDKTGKLIFREGTNIIEVNGHEYKATSSADLTAITTALKNTGYLTESGGVLTANNPGTVAALLGTKITASGDGKKTVSGWIDDILGQISGINTDITNLQNVTKTDSSSTFVVRDKSGEGNTDFETTTAIHTAINTAKTDAIDAAKKDASEKDAAVKKDLIGTGTASESSTKPLEPGDGNTWALNETKTLSSLKDLILNLQGQLTTLSGKDLTAVNNAITAIKKELSDGSAAGDLANTLIDKLSTFLGGKTSWTINGTTAANVAAIITALETEINARIASVSKANGETLIDVTTDANKAVSVSSTTALQTAVTNANAALPKGSGNTYTSAVDLASKLKGTVGDTKDKTTIEGAKTYAKETAKSYADNVITWTVIS